tara:strand:- start:54 stop:524 length:471 start_codon:yes stop_codon:yes gene_type:complete
MLYDSVGQHYQSQSKGMKKGIVTYKGKKLTEKEIQEVSNIISDFTTKIDEEIGGSELKLLEIRDLKNSIELSRQTINNLKNDFKRNIFYVFLGGLIGIISSFLLLKYQSTSEERIIQLSKLLTEKNEQQSDFQKRLNDMNKELFSLRKELDSLKKK